MSMVCVGRWGGRAVGGGGGGSGAERVTNTHTPDRHTCSFRSAEFNDLPKPIV